MHSSADNQPIAAGWTAAAFVVGRKRRNGPRATWKSPPRPADAGKTARMVQ
ncbi:hypothetical protein HMPREF7215_1413 [Pyramidobacter piscolens W5455]|uniref:Uncharacterized protein n=1 Tax=Pyramidobacter piscolens W5455 TaxID=352165 RepID=A0ABM9ZSW3_9BACT|nr:hypothetical protein HMPREF7215_1413 [Pyramidobacter piscolens W5455]